MEKINSSYLQISSPVVLNSGFKGLDKIIYAFEKSNLYVLAGRPGMGKTAFGLSLAHHMAVKKEIKVTIISYEMTARQIICRFLSLATNIANEKILNGQLDSNELMLLKEKEAELLNANITLECPAVLNFKQLKQEVVRLKQQNDIDFLIIDDIQRISISDEERKYASNREQEVSKNVRDLKALAKEIEIPILAISQLNRDNKEREDKRPVLTDMRDSGAIENDSDVVVFIYRPEYYGFTEDENGNSLLGIAEFEVAKNRHGSLGRFSLFFKKGISKYETLADNMDGFEEIRHFTGKSKMNEQEGKSPF